MKLYHGSDVSIDKIELSLSKPYKDFGKGFYLSADYNQAMDMAKERVRQKLGSSSPIVSVFEFDESILNKSDLSIKVWDDYCVEWAEFIIKNRDRKLQHPCHNYDIVYGPIADDGVSFQLRRFQAGYLTIQQLVEELKYNKGVTFQYFFANELAISKLKKI
ncbi:MAG: DUF3990 domain-containing protein [Muribaculum sp.]|nr:DUF3990 domain-containing protein [Muribaculum sp.]